MDEDPQVSYVICTYNSEEFIEDNLRSIKNQDYSNQEIIVVDNCSSDSTRKIIEEKFPEVQLIVMPNSDYGACETFNIGFETAKGKYIAILDDDVELEKKWTKELLQPFNEIDRLAVAQPKMREIVGPDERLQYENRELIQELHGASCLVLKSAIREENYYDEFYFIDRNDYELASSLICSGYKIISIPSVETLHKVGKPSEDDFRLYYQARNDIWYWWKYYDFKDAFLYSIYWFFKHNLASNFSSLPTITRAYLASLPRLPRIVKNRRNSERLDYDKWTFDKLQSEFRNLIKYLS